MRVAAMVIIDTDDPLLSGTVIDVSTSAKAASVRRAVLRHLPGAVNRVVMITSEELAQLMCQAHDAAAQALGAPVMRPPADYIPPTSD